MGWLGGGLSLLSIGVKFDSELLRGDSQSILINDSGEINSSYGSVFIIDRRLPQVVLGTNIRSKMLWGLNISLSLTINTPNIITICPYILYHVSIFSLIRTQSTPLIILWMCISIISKVSQTRWKDNVSYRDFQYWEGVVLIKNLKM